jgi:shikimate dehydrogenase
VSASAPITPRTDLCGIVLHPAGHTRSPAIHNAAFRALGLEAVYLAFDVVPEALGAAIAGARALGIRQLAVSLPHKQAVMQHLDEVDETARAIGAVNTVTRSGDGRLLGANTDWLGIVRSLEDQRPLLGAHAVVLGAGGTARAAVHGLVTRGARVTVLNRTESRGASLAAELGAAASGTLDELAGLEHDVLVNTTSVGLGEDASPVAADALRAESLVLDAVYEPERTRLLRDAGARGAVPISGRWMLIHQAAEQLRLWTGKDAPIDVMYEAFERGV